jgi:hypothetical protein
MESSFAVHPRFQTAPARHIIHHRLGFATWSWTMTILVTGSTGTIGSQVVQRLVGGIVNLAAHGMLVVSVARRLGSEGPLLAYCDAPL